MCAKIRQLRPTVSSVYNRLSGLAENRRAFWSRLLWTLLYGASFTLIAHLLWVYYVPAWVPMRRFFSGFPFILLLLIPAFGPGRWARCWCVFLYLLLIAPALICAQHVFLFHTPITSQSFYVIFETGVRESREFFLAQASWATVLLTLVTLLAPLFILWRILRLPLRFGRREILTMAAFAALVLILYSVYGERRVFRQNMAYDFFSSYMEYERNKARLEAFVAQSESIRFPGVENVVPGDPDRTLVVVIGESANRHHHALYGYRRPTNPELSALRQELLVFTDVISSHSQTIPTVREAMSFPGPDGMRLPLVNLFKQAGFETVWISNQISFENFYTEIAVLVSTAHTRLDLNRGGDQSYIRNFDEVVLPELETILKTPPPTGRRVVFIHLMGSHLNYASRYPPEFDFFTSVADIPDAPWRSEKAKAYINKYDNSIRYTDHVLARMIGLLKQYADASALVYFSDHGEEVYDSRPERGHANALNSPYYFDIPFLVWLSPSYRKALGPRAEHWKTCLDRPVINTDFPYVAIELAGLTMADEKRKNTLLSRTFTPRPRRILDGEYEQAFPDRPRPGGQLADGAECARP